MPRICIICKKGPMKGRSYKRRGLVKRKGGAGAKIVGKTIRIFYPNLQRIKANLSGSIKTVDVCTKCLKAGKIFKA